ncbi:MAG: hydroxymethylbilane synthase [Gemmatimonadota bacterium]
MTSLLLPVVKVGTRISRLARRQTGEIIAAIERLAPGIRCEEIHFVTEGDRVIDRPLPEMGGKGVFTLELEESLRNYEIDLAVHSLKDLPVESPPGLCIGAVCQRVDARDVIIAPQWRTLDALPPGARIGTCSTRRAAQVRARRPDLTLLPLRGNVDTRVRRVFAGEYDAIVLAAAGLERIGLADAITEYLDIDTMIPAPGQGALALQCRQNDDSILDLLRRIDEPRVRAAVDAERSFLAALGGGCSAPIAAHAHVLPGRPATLRLLGSVIAPDGRQSVRAEGEAPLAEATELGARLAADAIARGALQWL